MTLSELQNRYPYQKPRVSLQLITLGIVDLCGLIALFFAAFAAFSLVAPWYQAFFAALIIEVGLIVEALALINRPRSIYPWIGLVVSYVVSGTYNYTQAATVGYELASIELLALAFGPLSALAVVSLTFGNELRAHQDNVLKWQVNRAEWVETEYTRIEQQRLEAEQKRLEMEQKHAEKMARIEAKKDVSKVSHKNKSGVPKLSQSEMLERILEHLEKNGDTRMTQLAEQLGTSRSTLYRRIDELQQAGKVHKNGEGWKVMK